MSTAGSIKMRRTRTGLSIRVTGTAAQVIAQAMGKEMARAAGTPLTIVTFVDQGQDVLRWHIDRAGKVVDCQPFHKDLYVGAQVTRVPMPGDNIGFRLVGDTEERALRWPIESVEVRP